MEQQRHAHLRRSPEEVYGRRGLDLLAPPEQWPAITLVWEELHRIAPEAPVVLASGYGLASSNELAALGARAYIQKPYHPADLSRTIRRVLDSTTPSGTGVPAHPRQA